MKQLVTKKVLFICMFACLINNTANAGVADWVKRKKEQARVGVQKKINEARQTTNDLLKVLRENTNCLISGNCPPEKKQKLRSIAKKVGITIGVLLVAAVAIGIGAKIMSDGKDEVLPIKITEGTGRAVEITEFYPGYVHDGSDQSVFLLAALGGQEKEVQEFASLVKKDVLEAGTKLATAQEMHYSGEDTKRRYSGVKSYLEKLRDANVLLLQKVRAGVVEKVKEVYCDLFPQPSKWAVAEGIEVAQQKVRQYSQEVYQKVFQSIVDFLRNPQCKVR